MMYLFPLLNMFILAKDTFVIQTSDNKLHFISDHMATFPLPLETNSRLIKNDGIISKIPQLLPPSLSGSLESMGMNNLEINGMNNLESMDLNDKTMAKISRLDGIYFISDDSIHFYNQKIQIKEVLDSPIVESGIYITATQEHIPTFINNTVVIIAVTKVFLLDLYDYHSRMLEHKQILYLFHANKSIPRKDNEIFLNGKWWKFNSEILAIFIIKEKDGLNFMMKVMSRSEMREFQKRNSKPQKIPFFVVLSCFIFGISGILYFTRNLKYKFQIIKNKLFLGEFVKKACLIYAVSDVQFKEHKRTYRDGMTNSLVLVYYENDRGVLNYIFNNFFSGLVVTEATTQFHSILQKANENPSIIKNDATTQFHSNPSIIKNDSTTQFHSNPSIIKNNINIFNKKINGDIYGLDDEITDLNSKTPSCEDECTQATGFNEAIDRSPFFSHFGDSSGDGKLNSSVDLKLQIFKLISSLENLHSNGIVISRICPENIRITRSGHIKIQNLFDNYGWRSINQLSNIKKKNYIADVADDIFSLGCVLHYYLTGYHPFDLRDYIRKDRKIAKKNIKIENDVIMENKEKTEIFYENRFNLFLKDCFTFEDTHDGQRNVKDNENDSQRNVKDNENDGQKNVKGNENDGQRNVKDIKDKEIIKNEIPDKTSDTVERGRMKNRLCSYYWAYSHSLVEQIYCYIKGCAVQIGKCLKKLNDCFCKFDRLSDLFLNEKCDVSSFYRKAIPDDLINYVEYNILFNSYKIRLDDQVEHDFIYHTIKPQSVSGIMKLCAHPYFWDNSKCLEFISDFSDFLESNINFKPRIERTRKLIFQGSWQEYLDQNLIRTASSKRSYDFHGLSDLIRFIRNCHRHFQEINTKSQFKGLEGTLFDYFSHTFPELLMFLYRNSSFKDQLVLRKYYE